MTGVPFNIKDFMGVIPPDASFSGANLPGNITVNPITGQVEAGTTPSLGSGTATLMASGSGGSDSVLWPWEVVEPSTIPSSVFFSSGSLGDANSFTAVDNKVSVLANQTAGNDMVQTDAPWRPALTSFSGATAMQFGLGEVLELPLPDSNLFHVTMRIVVEAPQTNLFNPLLAGGNSTMAGRFKDGTTGAIFQNAGSPSLRLDNSAVTPANMDAWHDLLYPGSAKVSTISILNIDPTANSQWTDDPVWFFGYKAADNFGAAIKVFAASCFSDASQVLAVENVVESNSQGV